MYARYLVVAILTLVLGTSCTNSHVTTSARSPSANNTASAPQHTTSVHVPVAPAATSSTEGCAESARLPRLRGKIDRAVIVTAQGQLNLPMGSGRFLDVHGKRYLFCLERHYHEPGSGLGPDGWHKGVSVYDAT